MSEMTYENYDYMGYDYNRNKSYELYNISKMETDVFEAILIIALSGAGLTLLFFINYTLYKLYYKNGLFSRYKRKLKMEKMGEMNHELVEDMKNSEENEKKVIEMNIYIDDTAKSASTNSSAKQSNNNTIERSTQTDRVDDNGGGEPKNSNE